MNLELLFSVAVGDDILRCGLVVVWCGVVWCGVVWCGVARGDATGW